MYSPHQLNERNTPLPFNKCRENAFVIMLGPVLGALPPGDLDADRFLSQRLCCCHQRTMTLPVEE